MKRDEQAMWRLMLPWLLIIGVCGGMIVIVALDLIFNLGLSN
tara:strand:+ start:1234 stop:1359 length:126 start_codon:yes stop_codon:yes gene_type:complete